VYLLNGFVVCLPKNKKVGNAIGFPGDILFFYKAK